MPGTVKPNRGTIVSHVLRDASIELCGALVLVGRGAKGTKGNCSQPLHVQRHSDIDASLDVVVDGLIVVPADGTAHVHTAFDPLSHDRVGVCNVQQQSASGRGVVAAIGVANKTRSSGNDRCSRASLQHVVIDVQHKAVHRHTKGENSTALGR